MLHTNCLVAVLLSLSCDASSLPPPPFRVNKAESGLERFTTKPQAAAGAAVPFRPSAASLTAGGPLGAPCTSEMAC